MESMVKKKKEKEKRGQKEMEKRGEERKERRGGRKGWKEDGGEMEGGKAVSRDREEWREF